MNPKSAFALRLPRHTTRASTVRSAGNRSDADDSRFAVHEAWRGVAREVRGSAACRSRRSGCQSCCDKCNPSCSTTTTTTLPPACGDSGPTCNGTCPAGTHRDSLGTFDCGCLPTGQTGCGEGPFPACGGVCTGGEVCQSVSLTGDVNLSYCDCVAADSHCGQPGGPCTGPGRCATGSVCGSFIAGGTCGGECPPGEQCQSVQAVGVNPPFDVSFCQCVSSASTCQYFLGGTCPGACPAGKTCSVFFAGGAECGCVP